MNRFTKQLFFMLIPGIAIVFLISCEDYTDKLTGTNPSGNAVDVSNRITGFSPEIAGAGRELKVQGSNLSGTKMIYMGEMWISEYNVSDSEISFTVPANMTLGDNNLVLVFSGPERATKNIEVVPIPSISYFTPKAATGGEEVIATGNNLSFVTSLSVGDVSATITGQENTMIKFTMPNGATTSVINITNTNGTVTSSSSSIIACSEEPGNYACYPVINTNGDLEDAALGEASEVNGWGGLNGSLAPGVITDEVYYEGFQSVKITVEELGANPWNIQPTSNISIDPTATYHLSVWIKGTGIANAKFAIDEGGTPGWGEWEAPEVAVTDNEWTEISYTFSPTSEDLASGGDETVRFAVSMSYEGNVGGILYMDNLRVVKVE